MDLARGASKLVFKAYLSAALVEVGRHVQLPPHASHLLGIEDLRHAVRAVVCRLAKIELKSIRLSELRQLADAHASGLRERCVQGIIWRVAADDPLQHRLRIKEHEGRWRVLRQHLEFLEYLVDERKWLRDIASAAKFSGGRRGSLQGDRLSAVVQDSQGIVTPWTCYSNDKPPTDFGARMAASDQAASRARDKAKSR